MANTLKNRVAIVTGSGRGVGRAIALALAQEGAKVVTNDIIPGSAEATAEKITDIGGQATGFLADISKFEAAQKLVQKAVDEFGRLDILVNNAGLANLSARVWDMTEEDWDICVNANLKGTFNCTRHACGIMREQRWGRIINTTSIAWLGVPSHFSYSAAKAGIVGLTRAVAREVGRYGITCNVYSPNAATGVTHSGKANNHVQEMYEAGFMTKEQYEEMLNPPPPETIGPLIAYLCTKEAADINGQAFDIWSGKISIYSEPAKTKSIRKEEGLWTVEELIEQLPRVLLEGYKNPAPAEPVK